MSPFFVPLWFVTVVTNVFIVINVPFVINVTIVLFVLIVPNVFVVPIVTNVLAAPNAYTRFFFFGLSVTIGTSISSIEMPPCWKVSL